jgi:hypothetical protein
MFDIDEAFQTSMCEWLEPTQVDPTTFPSNIRLGLKEYYDFR